MTELSDFADGGYVLDRMREHGVEKPILITSKKGVNQYRQKAESKARFSLNYVSADFDLWGFPLARDLPVKERKCFTTQNDLLKWLMGKYEPPESSRSFLKWLDAATLPYTTFPDWLEARGIDIDEERDVKMRLLVTQIEPTAIPDTVKEAHDLGIAVRRYKKKGDWQPRGCVIDSEGDNPNVYHVFKDFEPGSVTLGELKPGTPQKVEEGKIWWGLATNNRPYIDLYRSAYDDEWSRSQTYDDVIGERKIYTGIAKRIRSISHGLKKFHPT